MVRRAYHGKFLLEEDGTFLGVDLGSDHVGEHERGIAKIQESFGINPNLLGIDQYKVTQVPKNIIFGRFINDKKKYLGICFSKYYDYKSIGEAFRDNGALLYDTEENSLAAAWNEESFYLCVLLTPLNKKRLGELYKVLQEGEATIGLGKTGPFQNGGIVICKTSAFSAKVKKQMMDESLDLLKLSNAAKKTEIEQYLTEHDKHYYALTPMWKPININSKYPVVFFLNPKQQKLYNLGWFTVEDLKNWAQDKGPIVKTKEEKDSLLKKQ